MEKTDEQTKLKGRVILIIEDDKFLADLLRKKLENDGAEVLYVNSGEMLPYILGNTVPDLFIVDILLPGIDGFAAIEKIRKQDQLKNVPVILLSNLQSDDMDQKVKKLPQVLLLIKSDFNLDELVLEIQKAISR